MIELLIWFWLVPTLLAWVFVIIEYLFMDIHYTKKTLLSNMAFIAIPLAGLFLSAYWLGERLSDFLHKRTG